MGVTADQAKALKDCMSIVKKDAAGNGKAIFEKMFDAHPEWIEKFPAWKGNSMAQVKASDQIKTHGAKIVNELAKWVDNIDSGSFAGIMKAQGTFHKGKNIGTDIFEEALPAIHAALQQQMGSAYTGAMKSAFDAAWSGTIVAGMKPGY